MPISKVISENQLQGRSPLLLTASHGRTFSRVMGSIELVLNASYLLCIELVLKDWLISYHERNYPYVASFATSVGIIVGFVALRRVHHPRLWRDVVLAGATILTAAAVAELLPQELGVLPAVSVLTCGLAGPSLLMGKDNITRRRRYFYAAAAMIGLIALINQPTHEPEKIFWGVIVALVTLSSGAIAVFIYRCGDKVGWRQKVIPFRLVKAGAVLLVGGIVLLFLIIMVPVLSLSIGETALLGLGMGWSYQSILGTGDIIRTISTQFHVVPAVPLMICSLAILPLLIRRSGISEWRLALYATAAIIGLAVFAWGPANLLGLGTGSNLLSIAKSARMASPESVSFALTLVKEQGLLVILILGCILVTCLSASVLVLTGLTEGQDQEARVSLCAGAISSFYGMLLGVHIGPPFLTGDSVAGTWTLAILVASLGIAASRLQGQARSRRPVYADNGVKKWRRHVGVLVGIGVVALATVVCVVSYQHSLDKIIQPFAGTATPPGYQTYVPLSSISREMQDATVAFEDPNFYHHSGIEWRSLHYALRVNLRAGRVVLGGSTITQQLAKNLFLAKDRTLRRKIKEAALALEMEQLLSKQRLLEIYLNTIDYGMGQHGVDAAARYYFHKTPSQLTLAEGAMLVGLVPHPPNQHLSLYQLLKGQRTALQRISYRWPDRYSEADIASAAQIPLDHLVYLDESMVDPTRTEQLPLREQTGARAYWRNLGICLAVTIFLGCGVTSALAWRVLRRQDAEPFGPDPRLGAKTIFLFFVAFFSALTVAAMHWHKANRERAEYTIIYPYSASQNHNDRPKDVGITSVVLHATAETQEGTIRWFLDPTSNVSAHFIVSKEGTILQSVPLEKRAWHAGVSELDGVPDVNNYSVGIEIVNRNDGMDPYPDVQYAAVAHIVRQLRSRYTIPDARIVSHAQVAPARKFDPVGFDFAKLRTMLSQEKTDIQ